MADIPINLAPKLPQISLTPSLVNQMLIVLIICCILIFIVKMMRHRILVTIQEKVHGGYVPWSGRYRLMFEPSTNMHYLRPMFSGPRLPAFHSKCFRTVRGAPFIGPRRSLMLIKRNRYSYDVLVPSMDTSESGTVEEYNSIAWVDTEISREFKRKVAYGQMIQFLWILAPMLVIVGVFGLFFIGVYYYSWMVKYAGDRIGQAADTIVNICTKRLS